MDTFEDNVYVVEVNEKGNTNQLSTSLLHKEEDEQAMVPSKSEIECLDDGRILLNNPPCLEIDTMLCEDKNDELAGSDNAYVIEYKERTFAAMGSTNILQEENDGNISMEEEVCEEEKEEDISKLGDVLEPPKDDSNTQNSIIIFENPCTSTINGITDNKECCLNMLYDNALDDGPILIDTCIHEDKNDELAGCDDALIHESPMLFLKSPIYTIEEKYAYVEKYLCGLQLSYENSYCSHDSITKNGTNNYFERGKHANRCHNKFDDHIYLPKISKMHESNSHFVKFSSSNCNYYERGGYEYPLYKTNIYKLHLPTIDMHCYTLIGCDSFIYKILMHRKKFRLRYYLLNTFGVHYYALNY
jgi:hypothetical protein